MTVKTISSFQLIGVKTNEVRGGFSLEDASISTARVICVAIKVCYCFRVLS